jgi:hypothetical protein
MRAQVYPPEEQQPRSALPHYELRARTYGPGDSELEIFQTPAPATPHIKAPVRLARLRGRNLELIEHHVLRRLAQAGVRIEPEKAREGLAMDIDEDTALWLGLIFRTLAPMRSRDNIRAVVEGVEAMAREEAAYWLGMAMHRKHPRRVLTALRMLLTDPYRPLLPR